MHAQLSTRTLSARTAAGIGAIGVATAVLAGVTLAGTAMGSPGSGITTTNYVTATAVDPIKSNADGVKLRTKDATDVRMQRLDFAPGSRSGWHHHPGLVIVAVQSGALTLTHADCSATTYGPGLAAGNVFVEGGDHPVEASSPGGATVFVTYVAPDEEPPVFRTEDDVRTC